MHVQDVIKNRYSVRAYTSDPVEQNKLERILNAARLAPTAVNKQPFRLIVIHTQGRKEELKRIYKREWFSDAPILICAVACPDMAWSRRDGKNYADVDTTIAMDHLILAATAEGLGTCWVAAFDPKAAREILNLPEDVEPIAFTPLGYAADTPGSKKRNDLDDLVHDDQW
jgi:nitroreductase